MFLVPRMDQRTTPASGARPDGRLYEIAKRHDCSIGAVELSLQVNRKTRKTSRSSQMISPISTRKSAGRDGLPQNRPTSRSHNTSAQDQISTNPDAFSPLPPSPRATASRILSGGWSGSDQADGYSVTAGRIPA